MAFILPGFPNELPVNAVGIPYASADTLTPAEKQSTSWGIYSQGQPVIVAEPGTTVSTISFKQDYMVSDYPIEGGSFNSYDKVYVPFDARLRFVVAGDIGTLNDFLSLLASISDPASSGLTLYDVVMPEFTFTSCSVNHYDFSRTVQDGLGILICDVWLIQVKVASAATSGQVDTQQPSGSDAINGGTAQTNAPTQTQQAVEFM